jgi:hypothetical protein
MSKVRHTLTLSLFALLTLTCLFASRTAVAQAVNLYQDALDHKALITKAAPPQNYSDSMCKLIDSCSGDGSAPKYGALPPATIDGHKVGRAVYLVKTTNPKEPETVVFEHQTPTTFYFFRLAPDGTILHTAYGETGQQWVPLANALGKPIFDKDIADWHTAFNKPVPAAAKPANQ